MADLEMMNFRKEFAPKVEKCLGKTEIPGSVPRFFRRCLVFAAVR